VGQTRLTLQELVLPGLIRKENFTLLLHSTFFPKNGPLPPYWHCTILLPSLQSNEGHLGPTSSFGEKMPPDGHLHFHAGGGAFDPGLALFD
jgi:hypothetical protein